MSPSGEANLERTRTQENLERTRTQETQETQETQHGHSLNQAGGRETLLILTAFPEAFLAQVEKICRKVAFKVVSETADTPERITPANLSESEHRLLRHRLLSFVSTAFAAKTPPFVFCFHCLRG